MLKDETLKQIAERSGIDATKFVEAIKSEETTDFAIETKGSFISDDNLATIKENVGKESAEKGSKTLIEQKVKELRNEHSLEFEGKTIDNLMKSYSEKQLKEAKIKPDEKVTELQTSIKRLNDTHANELGTKQIEIDKLNGSLASAQTNEYLRTQLPGLKTLEAEQFLTLAKASFNFAEEDGKRIVKSQDGAILKDKYETPLTAKAVLTEFATKNGWYASDGRGSGNEPSTGESQFKTSNEAMKHMLDNNIDPTSKQGIELLEKVEKAAE